MGLKQKIFPDGFRHFAAQMVSFARTRGQFNNLSDDSTYPLVSAGCEFDDLRSVRVGRHVRFLRGAVLLAHGGSISIGDNSVVARYAVVQAAGGHLVIGKRVAVGDFCSLYAQGGLSIGDDVLIASHVRIVANQHTFEDPDVSIARQIDRADGIVISDQVWIGIGATILDGVTIGRGAIIAAGSVVRHNVLDGEIVAGVPARRVRFRPGFDEMGRVLPLPIESAV